MNLVYTRGKALFSGSADWESTSQSFRVLLASSAYLPDRRHCFVSEVGGELAGIGYVRKELKGRAIQATDDRAACFADSVSFRDLSTRETYRWIVVFRSGDSDGASELVCALDMGEISLKGITDHTINWAEGRVFSIT